MDRRQIRASGDITSLQLSDLIFCIATNCTLNEISLHQLLHFLFSHISASILLLKSRAVKKIIVPPTPHGYFINTTAVVTGKICKNKAFLPTRNYLHILLPNEKHNNYVKVCPLPNKA